MNNERATDKKSRGHKAEGTAPNKAEGTAPTFVAVLVLEAAIIIALWFFQRAFS